MRVEWRAIPRIVAWRDALAVTALLVGIVGVYWPTILGEAVYARSDTFTFFYPVYATLHRSIREGQLPLWTPYIFSGFPLFAEGQIGALYPPAILAVLAFDAPINGFLALRVFHVVVAVLGAYVLARVLAVQPLGAAVAGLSFGFGSFIVGQQHHAGLLAAASWLPLMLACVELALRRADWLTQPLLAAAGLLLGLQALASHIQPVMLSGATLLVYVSARQAVAAARGWLRGGSTWARWRAGTWPVLLGGWALAIVPGIAAAVAAAQLLPLYELSQESWRAHGWSYGDAVEYSFPPINYLTLLFPFFFRSPDGGQWALWQAWEVVLYVGIVPLFLAAIAVVFVRSWRVAFFTLMALTSALLALGGYAPYGLYERVWTLPGVALQRAPARLTFLTTLALALLAAYGADWLTRRRKTDGALRSFRHHLLVLHLVVLGVVGALIAHLVIWRGWLHAERAWALRVLTDWYLSSLQDPLQALTALNVYASLDAALDLGNPKTALPLVMFTLLALLLLAWREAPRLAGVWQAGLALVVLVDLAIFASDFHPLVAADDLSRLSAPGELLATHAGPWRALTRPEVQDVRPNQLLPYRAAEVSGYSPLQLDRHRWYSGVVGTVDNVLLDLWNVRYVANPAANPSLPSYQQVGYHPQRPLMVGGDETPNGRLALAVPGDRATELRMIAALRDGAEIRDGEIVGEWTLTDADGVRRVVPIKAGVDIADWTVGAPNAKTSHRPVQAAAQIPVRETADQPEQRRTLSYTHVKLPSRVSIVRAEYRHLHPIGQTVLYGFGLFDRATDHLSQFFRAEKYDEVFRNADTVIYENRAYFPRAYVVPEAVPATDGVQSLQLLLRGPLDPRRQVVVEGLPVGASPSTTASTGDLVPAEIVDEDWSSILVRTRSSFDGYLVLADTYYPGWRALVDGREVPIGRANYLFRAVAVPSGEHEVAFVFDPPSLRFGATITFGGLAVAGTLILIGAVGWIASRVRRRVGRSQTT